MSQLPLEGLTIIDFTTLLPGPLATLMLAEAGAEVIKIEPPGGEAMRQSGPRWGTESAMFALLNAGKKCIEIDLKDPVEAARLHPLIEKADALVEQFRPGVMDRLGFGYDALRARNPGLIYCSITGYGQSGPMAQRAGHDLNYMAESGVLALNPGPANAPQLPPVLAADIAGGTYPAVINLLLALLRRNETGEGAHIDIAMSENTLPFTFWALAEGQVSERWPEPGDHVFSGGLARYQIYATADSKLVAVAALEEKFWQAFCAAIELPQSLRDDRKSGEASIAGVGRIIAAKESGHWREVLTRADCCCTVVSTLEEAVGSAQFGGRGVFDYQIEGDGNETLMALPLALSPSLRDAADKARRTAAPGADNALLADRE